MATILNPFTYIADPIRNRPVFNGQVYFGRPDTDPVQPENRIQVRIVSEGGLLVDIAQPVRTSPGGIALHQGNPVTLDLAEFQYSMAIQDNTGTQLYYAARVNIFGDLGNTLGNINQFRQFGTPRFITAANNNNMPFSYSLYARVVYDAGTGDRLYESLTNNNTSLPTNATNWRLVDITATDANYLNTSNNLGDLNNIATARENIGIVFGQADDQVPQIGAPATAGRSAVVVNVGSNANGNFRIWSDGFIQQYSRVMGAVTFPTAFTDNNYILTTSLSPLTNVGPVDPRYTLTKTATGFSYLGVNLAIEYMAFGV